MDPVFVALGLGSLLLIWRRSKKKRKDTPGPTPSPGPDVTPGGGPRPADEADPGGETPKTVPGGKRWGRPTKDYPIPVDWDPIRGLWVSPDCKIVIEAPGWMCGTDYTGAAYMYGTGFGCTAIAHDTYADTMAEPNNGVLGYVYHLIGRGFDPSEIAWTILEEVSPTCVNVSPDDWPQGFVMWWNHLLARLAEVYEEETGIPFDPFT